MATETQRTRLRRDIGADAVSLPDPDADAIYVEAAETYTTAGAAQDAYTRVIAIQGLLGSAAKLTSYRQNQSSESASDVFKHLMQLLEFWEGRLEQAQRAASGAMRSGRTIRRPARIREYPGT